MLFRRSDESLATYFQGPIHEGVIFNIRWVAILGQVSALLFTAIFLKLDLPLLPACCNWSVGTSQLWQIKLSIQKQRHWHNSMALGFDVLQLAGCCINWWVIKSFFSDDTGACCCVCGGIGP